MPISEAPLASAPVEGGAYGAALAAFRARHGLREGWAGAVAAYHAVRAMPYRSGPDRTPLTALRTGQGACTAKHLILRDLLRSLGVAADVELVEGDFAAGFRVMPGMPPRLAAMVAEGGVRDMHCWVRAQGPDGACRLDATWPDDMAAQGIAVNSDWDGQGDTRPALTGRVHGPAEDVLAAKAALLARLTPAETARRAVFLSALSDWIAGAQASTDKWEGDGG